jgi:hypothetical protein
MTPVVVSYCTDKAKIDAIPVQKHHTWSDPVRGKLSSAGCDAPIPESKSGTMAASVMMKSCRFLRESDH